MLFRPVLPEHVYHVLGLDRDRIRPEGRRSARMGLQHVVRDGVAERVERDAVHRASIGVHLVVRNPVGFDELDVQRHVR